MPSVNPISCIVIDNEADARETFAMVIARYMEPQLKLVGSCGSMREGIAAINKFKPELLFLNLAMPEENGHSMAEYFGNTDTEVIYTIDKDTEALKDGVPVSGDYIVKPVNPADLQLAVKRYELKKSPRAFRAQIENMVINLGMGADVTHKIALPTNYGFQMEQIHHIMYCEADANYTRIHMFNDHVLLVSKSLKTVEEMISRDFFFRIHKSYLINLNFLKSYSKDKGFSVTLDNGTTLPVAMRKNEEFVRAITRK